MIETASIFQIPVAKVTESEAVERIVALAKMRHPTTQPPAYAEASTFAKATVDKSAGKPNHTTTQPPAYAEATAGKPNHQTTQPPNHSAALVATLNVDFVVNAVGGWPFGGNDELWGYLKSADMVTADGMPIVLLSKLLRDPLPERVTGADMLPAICSRFAEEGLSVYVLGGDKAIVEEAFAKLPPVKVAGIDPAFVKLDEEQPEIVERINAVEPDIVFVALGNPKQELWMGRNAAKLKAGVMIGVGGTFNFITGKVKRAPRWIQRSGLEWIYRIYQEPGRLWRRYAYGFVKFSWLSLLALFGRYK